MMRNLFASDDSSTNGKNTLRSYLDSLRHKPLRAAGVAALAIVPAAALVGWYYSFAMSVANISPQNATTDASLEVTTSESIKPLEVSEGDIDEVAPTQPPSSQSTPDETTATTDVQVNGQSIPVPDEGSVHRVIKNKDGETTVDISVKSDTSGTSRSHSSTNIQMNSSTDLSGETKTVIEEDRDF